MLTDILANITFPSNSNLMTQIYCIRYVCACKQYGDL